MKLSDVSIHAWIVENQIKNERGEPIDFRNHLFLYDIYSDFSPKLVCYKAAQVGFSTLAILKKFFVAYKRGMDLIYTLPTQGDVYDFVGGKVNRIIAANPILQEYVKDRDTMEQKRVGNNVVYYRGTFTEKQALMVPSDWNIHDEEDRCFEPDTEILTKRGWIKIQSIFPKDRIATLNPSDHRVVFQKPTKIIRSNYNGFLYRFMGKSLDIAVTKNHRMWARTAAKSGFQGRKNPYAFHAAPSLENIPIFSSLKSA